MPSHSTVLSEQSPHVHDTPNLEECSSSVPFTELPHAPESNVLSDVAPLVLPSPSFLESWKENVEHALAATPDELPSPCVRITARSLHAAGEGLLTLLRHVVEHPDVSSCQERPGQVSVLTAHGPLAFFQPSVLEPYTIYTV